MIDLDYRSSDYFRLRYEDNEYDEFLLIIFSFFFILNNLFEIFFHEKRLILISLLFDFSSGILDI